MPTAHRIATAAHQPEAVDVSIVLSPTMTPKADGIEATMDVHNGHAAPHVEDGNADSSVPTTSHPDDTNQDVFAQWDALLQRESHPTYTQHEPLPTFAILPRSILAQQFFSIVDYYNIDRSTISVALSYLDRLTSQHGIIEHADMACAGFTCFYLAVKLNSYGGKKFHMAQLVKLSCGIISSVENMADMESHVCEVLDWYLNDVIPVMYVDVITPLLLTESSMRSINADEDQECAGSSSSTEILPPESKEELIETARYLCELSTMDAFFSNKRPSSIAYASVLVAMDILQFSPTASKWFVSLPLDHDPEETEVCIQCLHEMYPREDAEEEKVEEEKLPCATSSDDDCNDQTKDGVDEHCRAVTPLKGDVSPSGTKRIHQDMALESYDCENDRDSCAVELSPKRMRAQ